MSRLLLLATLVIATACSRRSPWVAAPAPSATGSLPRASAPSPQTQPTDVALATIAPGHGASVESLISLYFPVGGMEGNGLADSFDDSRDGGDRRHNAIDIMAPRGTPVLSVQDGRVLRLSESSKGGITIYATDNEERYVFYYAHLDRYHENLSAGRPLMRGDTIGYVGTTGNAPENVPHLHFQMMRMPRDRKYWNGEPINPYPMLRRTMSASTDR